MSGTVSTRQLAQGDNLLRYGRGPLVRGSLVLMESLWAYALIAFLVALTVGGGKPSFLGTLFVVGGAFTISRVLQGTVLSLGVLRLWGAFLSLLLFYAVVRIDFYGDWRLWDFRWLDLLINDTGESLREGSRGATAVIGVPLLGAFWVRGILRGQQSITFDDVLGSFALGVMVMAGVLVFGSFVDDLPRFVEISAVPYVAVGLLAIGLAHASRASDSFERQFTSVWLLAVGGTIASLALIALLFALIDFGLMREGLGHAVHGLGWLISGLLYVLAWPLVKLLEGVFWGLRELIELLGGEPGLEEQEPVPPGGAQERGEPSDNSLPGWLETFIRYSVGGVLLTALFVGVAVLFQRFQRPPRTGEQRESVYEEGRLVADLGNFLGSVFGRRRTGGAYRPAEPVRRLYFEMLETAQSRGVARQPTNTPLELSPRLEQTFHSQTPAEITGLFDDVRYGGREPSSEEVRRLWAEWDGLQRP